MQEKCVLTFSVCLIMVVKIGGNAGEICNKGENMERQFLQPRNNLVNSKESVLLLLLFDFVFCQC